MGMLHSVVLGLASFTGGTDASKTRQVGSVLFITMVNFVLKEPLVSFFLFLSIFRIKFCFVFRIAASNTDF